MDPSFSFFACLLLIPVLLNYGCRYVFYTSFSELQVHSYVSFIFEVDERVNDKTGFYEYSLPCTNAKYFIQKRLA